MRERRQVAGSAHRALRGNARRHAGVDERDERFDHRPAHAGVAAGERGRLQRHDEAHDRIVEQRARAGGMRQHERALQLGEARVVDARPCEEPESRVDAVDRAARGDDAVDRQRRGIDRRLRGDIDRERHGLRPETAQIGEPETGRH